MDYSANYTRTDPGELFLGEFDVERPRITQLFERALKYQLVTVCAGTGYGKTSSVHSFLREHKGRKAWIQLTGQDNAEASFWDKYVNTMYSAASEMAQSLLHNGLPKTENDYEKYFAFARAVYPRLVERYSEFFVIFDDMHLITNQNILRFIEQAIRFKVPKKTTFIISRKDPLISLPGLASDRIMPGITEDDLCFTEDEIGEYLRKIGVSLSTQRVSDIYRETQGWAFALALIGRSLQKSPEYRSDLFGAMKNNIYKVFEAELLSVISERLKNFLIRLSLLDRLPAELLGELATDGAVIDEMEQQSAYIRYDPYMNTYIIHWLLLEYLREHQDLLSEKDKSDTYNKAGKYCERNNYTSDAIAYYEKAGDYAALIELIYNKVNMQIPFDIAEELLVIFESAPARVVKEIELFAITHLRILLSLGRFSEAISLGTRYEKQFLETRETKKSARTLSGVYLHLGIAHEMLSTDEDRCDFLPYYIKQDEVYSKNPFTSEGTSAIMMTGSWASSVGAEREGALEEHISALTDSEPYLIHGRNGYGAGRSDITAGELMYYRNAVKEAERLFTQGLQKARSYRQFAIIQRALFYLIRLSVIRGDADSAGKHLAELKEILSEEDYIVRYETYDIACGWYYLKLGQLDRVPDWLKSDFLPYAHAKHIENYGNQIKLLHCFITKDFASLLNFTGRRKERSTIVYERIESQVFEACAYYQMKDQRASFGILREAYETASPNRIVAPFIEMGKDMRTLTAAALRDEELAIPDNWLKAINRQSSSYAKHLSFISAGMRDDADSEIRLSDREREVLLGLSQGLTRTEIAGNAGLSPNTIKMITGSLYEKIGASNIADAIRIGVGKNLI